MRQNEVVATVNNDNKEGKAMKRFAGFKKKLVAGAAGAMMAVNMLPDYSICSRRHFCHYSTA